VSLNNSKNPDVEIFECPKAGEYKENGDYKWIDCMPKIGENMSKFCSKEYLEFISKNCKSINIVY
jgi:hypothetical protein